MKLTNELREYVQRRMAEIIPEPTSKEDADKVEAECKKLQEEFKIFINEKINEFINALKFNPIVEGCVFSYNARYGSTFLNYDTNNSEAVKLYKHETEEVRDFRQRVVEKVFALLSVQKEVGDLDTFIANVVASVSK